MARAKRMMSRPALPVVPGGDRGVFHQWYQEGLRCRSTCAPRERSWSRRRWIPSRPRPRLWSAAPSRSSESERLFAVDVLRGFALLGILAMNIVDFAWPGAAYGNPLRGGGFEGTDRAVWFFNHLVFEGKMMTIFSMLFGAGLVLMDQRAAARGRLGPRRLLSPRPLAAGHRPGPCLPDLERRHPGPVRRVRAVPLPVPQQVAEDADHPGRRGRCCSSCRSPGLRRGDRLHEGRDGPGRGPGRRPARRRPRFDKRIARHLDGSISRRNSSRRPSSRPRNGTRRWRSIAAATSGSSRTAPCRAAHRPDLRLHLRRPLLRRRPDAHRHGADEAGRLLGRAVAAVLRRRWSPWDTASACR